MSWGSPFRSAWDAAASGARAAAREAVTNPEKAASLMSEALAHTLQRTQYAAQDVRRWQQAAETPDAVAPQAVALCSAMEDVRLGKVPPERAEKHVQQALRTAAGKKADPEVALSRDEKHALQRFLELRKRVLEQLEEAQGRRSTDSLPTDARRNAGFAHSLDRTFALIDALFLENKLVDDPAAPLPPGPRPMKEDASCPSQRA